MTNANAVLGKQTEVLQTPSLLACMQCADSQRQPADQQRAVAFAWI